MIKKRNNILGDHLRMIRRASGKSLDDIVTVARHVGFDISKGTISKIETGDTRSPRLQTLLILQQVYGYRSIEFLLAEQKQMLLQGKRMPSERLAETIKKPHNHKKNSNIRK